MYCIFGLFFQIHFTSKVINKKNIAFKYFIKSNKKKKKNNEINKNLFLLKFNLDKKWIVYNLYIM